jgi:acyl carrier protein
MGNEIFESIKEFSVKQQGINESDVTQNASLQNDLGIYGDDAIDFLVAFSKKFNVDISKFMAADYFNPEGVDVVGTIVRLFTGKKKKEKKELTMRHLEKAVRAGKLDETIMNS